MTIHVAHFDWAEARQKLDRLADAVAGELPEATRAALMTERARRLAAPEPKPHAGATIRAVICRHGDAVYGFPVDHVQTVTVFHRWHKIPALPRFMPGVVSIRGEVVPAVDLGQMFQGSEVAPPRYLVAIGTGGGEFAIPVHDLIDVQDVAVDDLRPIRGGDSDFADLIRGLTPDAVALVDTAAMLYEPRLFYQASQSRSVQEQL